MKQAPITFLLARAALTAIVAFGVLLVCLGGPVRFLALRPEFYRWGQSRHVFVATPSPDAQMAADRALARYFAGPANSLQKQLRISGLDEEFFTERERVHLEDVHWLLQSVGVIIATGFGMIVFGIVLGAIGVAGVGLVGGAQAARWGATLAIAILILFGAGSLLDFQALFLQFHLVSFSNDLWQLDPAKHNLIRIFPYGFFLEAAITDASLSIVVAVSILGGTSWFIHLHERNSRRV